MKGAWLKHFRVGDVVQFRRKGIGCSGTIVKLHASGTKGSAEIRGPFGRKVTRKLQYVAAAKESL